MSKLIPAASVTEAWLKGLLYLSNCDDWRAFNVILDISKPLGLSPDEKLVAGELGGFLESHGKKPISTVINTIFPASLDTGQGFDEVIKEYLELAPELCRHPDNKKWGTYFMRICARKDNDGNEIRPLEELISRLRRQSKVQAPKYAWYELNVVDQFMEIPIYDNLKDPRHLMGGPCLSHLSFKLKGGRRLMLTAFYRSHFYIERTLGNLYGLAMLQNFVAREAGLEPAELVCHSSMAQIDHGDPFSEPKVRRLMQKCWKLGKIETNGAS